MAPRESERKTKVAAKRKSVKEAADAAEKRAGQATKAEAAKPAAAPPPAKDKANDTDTQNRALFLHHLPKIADLKDKVAAATANLRNAYKTAKADGFLKDDFDAAFEIQGADGEKKKKAAIARHLQIAQWLGCDLGAQLDLFVADARVPAADRSYEEGKTDCLMGKAAQPSYDPSTEQYRRYMEGFHSATESLIKSGISKLHPEVQKDEADKAAKKAETEAAKAQDAKAFDAPSSGVAMTREEYKKQQAARDGQGDTTLN